MLTCLLQVKEQVKEELAEFFSNLADTGCTLTSDGWTDVNGRALINFVLCTPEGVHFVSSVDCGMDTKDGRYIADQMAAGIEAQGAANVVLVVMDNASACVSAGNLLEARCALCMRASRALSDRS